MTDPDALFAVLNRFCRPCAASAMRPDHCTWLHPELKKLDLPVVCLETQHVRAALSGQRNKTDKADALGIAHIMRTGWFRQAYIKSQSCYRTKLLLTRRRNLKAKFLDLQNAIRHSLNAFGIRLGKVGRGAFDQAVRTAVAEDPLSSELMDAMLSARSVVATVLPAARSRRQNGGAQRTVPNHGHPRRRPGHSTFAHDGDRRPRRASAAHATSRRTSG